MASKTQSAVMMYGRPVAQQMEERVAAAVPDFVKRYKVVPTLAIVQVGRNPASERYIRKKIESCARLGMHADLHQFEESISADDLKREVDQLSRRPEGLCGAATQRMSKKAAPRWLRCRSRPI